MERRGFAIRFHLHPDVDATLDMGGTAVSMALRSGEIWVFRHDGAAELALEASVYLEKGRLKPRALHSRSCFRGEARGLRDPDRLDLGEGTGYSAGHPRSGPGRSGPDL